MRADRLLSLLMLLQTRGIQTAGQLAETLEVTERTIYRDIDALGASGAPVYAVKGPGGGFALLEDYRTNLTGLTPDEVKALFMLSIPPALDQLGAGEALRTALLKLSASLPDSRRIDESGARDYILLDPQAWSQSEEPAPHLQTCQAALWQRRVLDLVYRSHFDARLSMHFAPYGLVAKANRWHLVGERSGNLRVLAVDLIRSASLSDETFERPPDFDLSAYWKAWCAERDSSRPGYRVRARVSPKLAEQLTAGHQLQMPTPPQAGDQPWPVIELYYDNLGDARKEVLSYGGAIEVLEPLALRRTVEDYARQILGQYEETGG